MEISLVTALIIEQKPLSVAKIQISSKNWKMFHIYTSTLDCLWKVRPDNCTSQGSSSWMVEGKRCADLLRGRQMERKGDLPLLCVAARKNTHHGSEPQLWLLLWWQGRTYNLFQDIIFLLLKKDSLGWGLQRLHSLKQNSETLDRPRYPEPVSAQRCIWTASFLAWTTCWEDCPLMMLSGTGRRLGDWGGNSKYQLASSLCLPCPLTPTAIWGWKGICSNRAACQLPVWQW